MSDSPSAPPTQTVDTVLAHAGTGDTTTGAVAPPLHLSTTFARGDDYSLPDDFIYARYGSPTLRRAERVLQQLDGGADALLFGAGLGATAALLETLKAGDRLVAPTVMYHGAQEWMRRLQTVRGIRLALFDPAEPHALEAVLEPEGATMVWIECPVNPTWDVLDIADTAATTHAAGAILVVDSTVAPPVTTRPLELGADIVLHSATKYLNGHSDVLGGALIGRERDARWEEVERVRKLTGGAMAGFDAWLLLRGIKTLGVRFDRVSDSALRIARHFEGHPHVETVLYPGLESHPGHVVAREQMQRGFGGMLSLLVRGSEVQTLSVAKALRVFVRATSLGGVESLVEHRATVEGPYSVVPKNLLRFSVGLEDPGDLIADLEQALASLGPAS